MTCTKSVIIKLLDTTRKKERRGEEYLNYCQELALGQRSRGSIVE
jgi:hypothetical protein